MTATPHSNESTPAPAAGAVALLFSGGLDTTLEVVERLKTHRRVHLVTFDNGCCINLGGAVRRVAELARAFDPERIRHVMVNTRPLMQALLAAARKSPRRSRSPLVFDLACKLAGVTELIAYARREGIAEVSDGASRAQTQVFIQHPDFAAHIEPFFAAHGIRLLHPVMFNVSRREKIALLKRLGFDSGLGLLEHLHITSQLAHQPFCMRGFVTFFYTSPLRHLPPATRTGLPLAEACRLWDELLPAAQAYLAAEPAHGAGPAARR